MTRGPLHWLVLVSALTGIACPARAAAPLLELEVDVGTLRVVHLDDFDPPAPGERRPPSIGYHERIGEAALTVERPRQTTDDLLARLDADPANMSGRQFVLAVVELTRQSLDIPLLAPELDAYSLEQLLVSQRGICRHQARLAEAVFRLLQPLCPAARDLDMMAYGDRFTHSWLRVTAVVPSGSDWTVLETHVDVAAGRDGDGQSVLDLASGEMAGAFPLRGMILMDAGRIEPAMQAWLAHVDAPTCPRRGAALAGLLATLVERGALHEAASLAERTLEALEQDERALQARDTGITPEQLAELWRTVYESMATLHARQVVPGGDVPDAAGCEIALAAQRQLRDDLVSFTTEADDFLAHGDLAGAHAVWQTRRTATSDRTWAWDAAFADVLRRGAMTARRAGQADLALQMTAARWEIRPDDPEVGVQLANEVLLRVQAHARGEPIPLHALRDQVPSLPEGLPETHLVRAQLAELDGDGALAAEQWQALVATCDRLPAPAAREQLFALHGLVSLQHQARATGDEDAVRALAADSLPRIEAVLARPLTSEQRENLAVLWWDLGITLTIVDRDPALAVRIWEAYVAWAPDDARARYGLARGLVQRAQREIGDARGPADLEVAAATAGSASAALQLAVTLDVPVPEAQSYLRLAWFNLATVFESHGERKEAVKIARSLQTALPDEPDGHVLIARGLGLLAADARAGDRCSQAEGWLDEGERHLAAAATTALPDHLQLSAAVAHHSLAVGAANCGDLPRANALVQAGLQRFPRDQDLEALQEQLSGLAP